MKSKYTYIIVGILVAIIAVLLIVNYSKDTTTVIPNETAQKSDTTEDTFETVKVTRNTYSFEAPKNWIVNNQTSIGGCLSDGISNDTSDGHRMAGEIGIYKKSCFNLANAMGKKEFIEKNGYYIIAFYDRESGTTAAEELETKAVYVKVVATFALRNTGAYTYKAHGFSIELPNGFVPQEQQSEASPGIGISLPQGGMTYVTDASWWEQFSMTDYVFVKNQKIGSVTWKVYNYDSYTIYWFKQGNVGYQFTGGDISQLETFRFVGWN